MKKQKIVVAGASGYIGKRLIEDLDALNQYDIVGLSRSSLRAVNLKNTTFKQVNLLSYEETEKVLEGCDLAVYLVHSMESKSYNIKGVFSDLDLLNADNFSRAASKHNLKKIVFLSGLLPSSANLSKHLQSRLEVEKILGSYGNNLFTIRSGLIVGKGCSSFEVMIKLVKRVQIMACSPSANNQTQIVSLDGALKTLKEAIQKDNNSGEVREIGANPVTTYKGLLSLVSRSLGLKRIIFTLPFDFPAMAKFWVSVFSGAPRSLSDPLIDSMNYPMVVVDNNKECNNCFEEETYPILEKAVASVEKGTARDPIFQATGKGRKTKFLILERISSELKMEDFCREYVTVMSNKLSIFGISKLNPDNLKALEYFNPNTVGSKMRFLYKNSESVDFEFISTSNNNQVLVAMSSKTENYFSWFLKKVGFQIYNSYFRNYCGSTVYRGRLERS